MTDDNIPTTYVAIDNLDQSEMTDIELEDLMLYLLDGLDQAKADGHLAIKGPLAAGVIVDLRLEAQNQGDPEGGSDLRGLR